MGEDIILIDFHRGLMVYRQKEKGSDSIFVTSTLLDIDSRMEVNRDTFVVEEGKWHPSIGISKLPGPKTIMDYRGETLSLYLVEEGEQVLDRKVNLGMFNLVTGCRVNGNLQMSLVGKDLLHVSVEDMLCRSVVGPVSRHLLLDISTIPLCLGDLFVVDPKFKMREDNINLAATKVVAQENTFILLSITPDTLIGCSGKEFVVKSSRLMLGQTVEEVIKEDKERAGQFIEQKRQRRELDKQLLEEEKQVRERNEQIWEQCGLKELEQQQKDQELRQLGETKERYTGVLLNWRGSFGFIMIDDQSGSPNIFVHISDIRKPRPFLTSGKRLEFSVEFDQQRNKTKAVRARAI